MSEGDVFFFYTSRYYLLADLTFLVISVVLTEYLRDRSWMMPFWLNLSLLSSITRKLEVCGLERE